MRRRGEGAQAPAQRVVDAGDEALVVAALLRARHDVRLPRQDGVDECGNIRGQVLQVRRIVDQHAAAGDVGPGLQGVGDAALRAVGDDPHERVLGGEVLEQLRRPIVTAVVDDHQLDGVRQRQHRLARQPHELGEVVGFVLGRNQDEADNLAEFVRLTREAMLPLPYAVELVIVNDGSHDGSPKLLEDLTAKHPFVRVVTHRTQRGIADALKSGADVARGRVLVYYPADLQYLPSDIPALVDPILAGQADVVTGTKQGGYNKRFVSGVYNALCRWLFGVRVKDLNSVKAYRREIMDSVPMRPDWHRFMVVIAASQGYRLAERPVPVHPRHAGASKFGIGRIPVGVLDLMSVWFQLRFGRKPMLFFGVLGATLFS